MGSPADVANEPEPAIRKSVELRTWTTTDGCLVRTDVILEFLGPQHCGQETARTLTVGDPVGSAFTSRSDSVTFVRDPNGSMGDRAVQRALRLDAALPDDAEDTGFRQGSTELWVVPDMRAIYLSDGDDVERWPRRRGPRRYCL